LKEGFLTETTSALATFLTNIGTILTAAAGWIGTIISVVMDNPVLLVPFALGIAFTGIVMFKALRH
jgi:hypothetical protein